MKDHFIISLAIVVLAVIFAMSVTPGQALPPIMIFGAVCCLAGLLCLVISLFFALGKQKGSAMSFLLAAGITFLIGTGACSTLLLGA